jgi:hypothetical protein
VKGFSGGYCKNDSSCKVRRLESGRDIPRKRRRRKSKEWSAKGMREGSSKRVRGGPQIGKRGNKLKSKGGEGRGAVVRDGRKNGKTGN